MSFTGANRLMGIAEGRFDGHAHVFRADLPMAQDRRYTPAYDADLTELAGLLRGHGLNGAILVQPSFLGTDNSYMLSALTTQCMEGLTLCGVVMLDTDTSTAEIAEMSSQGIIGMRLNLVGGAAQGFDVAAWDRVLRRIDAAGWHVELHCEGAFLPSLLDALLKRCRTVVVDHFGLPGRDTPFDKHLIRAAADQLMVKISAPYRVFPDLSSDEAAVRCIPITEKLLDDIGPENLIWGSDWPWTRFEGRHTYPEALHWQGKFEGEMGES